MKRFLSILTALVLLVSMFAVTSVAFAEEQPGSDGDESETTPARVVKFNAEKFREYVLNYKDEENNLDAKDFYLEMNSDFMFENKWWEDWNKVNEIFEGIHYTVQPEEKLEGKVDEYYVHYVYNPEGHTDDNTKYTDAPVPVDAKYKETQHFPLPSALDPIEDDVTETPEEGGDPVTKKIPRAYFAGWKITYGYVPTPADSGDTSENNGEASDTPDTTIPEGIPAEEQPEWTKCVYKAGTSIAMPAAHITVEAVWVPYEEGVDGEQKAKDLVAPPDDKIYVLYVSPSGAVTQDMQDWSRCLVTSDFGLTSEGEWNFRFAVVDGVKASESGYTFKEEDILADTFDDAQAIIDAANEAHEKVDDQKVAAADCTLKYRAKDTKHPQIDLTETQKNKQVDGLTVGVTYSISSSVSITDVSSTTSTYKVYKNVGKGVEGADNEGWLLIYDYGTRVVTDGYSDCISTGGVITPLASDVTGEYMYKIVYSVVDAFGYYGVAKVGSDEEPSTEEYNPTMLLRVNANPIDPGRSKQIEAWKIVLYVVAGLSLVGIIVLLCIKPKQQTADARYNNSTNVSVDSTETTTEQTEDSENDSDKVE